MRLSKKAMELSTNTIIIALIALIVLVVIVIIFGRSQESFVDVSNSCTSIGGECKSDDPGPGWTRYMIGDKECTAGECYKEVIDDNWIPNNE